MRPMDSPVSQPPASIPPSIPADSSLLLNALRLLDGVEALPETASGAMRFGSRGLLLIESRRVCWGVANGMSQRLTELLRRQRNPPLPRAVVEQIFRECKETGRHLGEVLLESGDVSEEGLRAALFRHTTEAVAHIARAGGRASEFVPYAGTRYDARFAFGTTEIFASLGARRDRALGVAARRHLEDALVPDAGGFAFIRDGSGSLPVVIAERAAARFGVSEVIDACQWSASAFDVAQVFEPETHLIRAAGARGTPLVTWRKNGIYYGAICASQAVSSLQLAHANAALGGEEPP